MIRRFIDWLVGPASPVTRAVRNARQRSGPTRPAPPTAAPAAPAAPETAARSAASTRPARAAPGKASAARGGAGAEAGADGGSRGERERRGNGRPRGRSAADTGDQDPQRISHDAPRLGLRPGDISTAALRTCEGLRDAGYQAWVVGGGVRDLLLDLQPKDFDVATNATPLQVQRAFRRARLIGRRFQIVHVMFGRETIEVTTFRAAQREASTDEHGRVLRDNEFGTQREDALRRDFTVNALYYDPIDEVIVDYLDGIRDLQERRLRMIGDPATRYREDPVRMLRTIRFASRLDLDVDPPTLNPIRELAPLLRNVPSARLFDEMLKLLQCGHALECMRRLRAEGLHHGVLPLLDSVVDSDARFVTLALEQTDRRVREDRSISPGFLFATLLWPQVLERWRARRAGGELPIPALGLAIDSVLDEQADVLAIQRRFQSDMREIWMLQPRLEKRGRSSHRLLEAERFRAGYDFLLLRCDAGEIEADIGHWWTRFIDGDDDARQALLEEPGAQSAGARRRRRRRSGRQGEAEADGLDTEVDGFDGPTEGVVPVPQVAGRVSDAAGAVGSGPLPDPVTGPAASEPALPAAEPEPRPVTAFVGLGANLGNSLQTLQAACEAIASLPQTQLLAQSRVYRSAPVDCAGPDFHNQVVEIRTTLSPRALLRGLADIEEQHGRVRSERNAPRTLDLDILLYGRRRLNQATLTIPHPRMHERLFVLQPLLELAPDIRIPGRHRASDHMRELLDRNEQRCEPLQDEASRA